MASLPKLVSTTILVAAGVFSSFTLGQTQLPDELVDGIIEQTQAVFWGNAVDHQGDKIMLPAGADPAAPVLPLVDARRVVGAAVPVGLAMWCDLEWRPSYLAFMQHERRSGGWSETQIAFIGMLFGMAQGTTETAMSSRACTPEQREQVAARLY